MVSNPSEFVPPICQLSLHCKTTNGDIADIIRQYRYPDPTSSKFFPLEKCLEISQ
jgi:hypothetical protein